MYMCVRICVCACACVFVCSSVGVGVRACVYCLLSYAYVFLHDLFFVGVCSCVRVCS